MKSFNFIDLIYRLLYWVCILNFGVCSVFEFSACGGMNGTTNLAVVDLSPYGFVFKELALHSLILNEFSCCFIVFSYFCLWMFPRSNKKAKPDGVWHRDSHYWRKFIRGEDFYKGKLKEISRTNPEVY